MQTATTTATPSDGYLKVLEGTAVIDQADLTTGRERVSLAVSPAFAPATNTVAYFACDATWTDLPLTATGSYFLHWSVTTNETASFYARLGANLNGAPPGMFHASVANANWSVANAVPAPRDLTTNTTYRLVVRYDLTTQNTTLWVDPLQESDPSATATDPAAGAQKSIAAISLRQGLSNSSSGAPGRIRIDNLTVGGTFREVLAAVPPKFTLQPAGQMVPEGGSTPLSAQVASPGGVLYSWFRNGQPIPGATNANLTLARVELGDDGAQYFVTASNSLGSATSEVARLAVVRDTVPPQLVSAANEGLSRITLQFSKAVDPASVTNPGNYAILPSLQIKGVQMLDSRTVALTVSGLVIGRDYTIGVSGVQDLASIPNQLPAGAQISFVAATLRSITLGGNQGDSVPSGDGMDVTFAGGDLGGTADSCQFSYRIQAGDFDVSVRVDGIVAGGPFSRAGLMARTSLDGTGPMAAATATASMVGCAFLWRNNPGDAANETGSFPVNYPSMWLRLQRVGNEVNGYASYDGVAWQLLGTGTLQTPSLYLGFAVSGNEGVTSARFRQFGDVVQGFNGTQPPPHEPIGPSSRRTQLAFSEILYTPAARSDGRDLEFVELYNSNPWWDDISGYRIAGLVSYTFPPNTRIPGGGYLVIAAAPADIQAVYGITNLLGPYSGSLKKTGRLQFVSNLGAVLLDLTYDDVLPWPAGAHGTGHSIILANPTYGEADPRAWSVSDSIGGSPGSGDPFTPSPLRQVVINEFLAHHDAAHGAFVELYNHATSASDISGCRITDGATNTFVIPPSSMIPAGGHVAFTAEQMGFDPAPTGGRLLLWSPDSSRVLDAVTYEPQALNTASGRWPDGARDFYPLQAASPGQANGAPRISPVVINELMYKPISGDDADQYVEVFNRGATPVDLSNWSFIAGPSFQFAQGTTLPAGGFLVVAEDAVRLRSHYPQLNLTNTVGNFSGRIPHGGGRIALARPELFNAVDSGGKPTTLALPVVEDEVTFGTGGRWGTWAHGGGSSLELSDPNSNHRLAANWGDSDESRKSAWTNLVVTAVLDNGANYGTFVDQVQLGLLDVGEMLVDNVSVRLGTNGPNLLRNGDFEAGFTNWTLLGDHLRSSLETPDGLGGFQSANAIHLRSSDAVWVAANAAQGTLNSGGLTSGKLATLSLAGRWLHGSPEVLLRLHGNWLELAGALPIPTNLGTPGLPNSQLVSAPRPAIHSVSHAPAIPRAGQAVVVTARIDGAEGGTPTLQYRIDTQVTLNPGYTSVPMVDDGTGGDGVANDGIYSASIPAQPAGTVVAFIITATAPQGGASRFPFPMAENAGLPYECVVVFGDPVPGGSFGHYHLWMTQNWIARWASGGGLSNEANDATFVDGGGRIIYNITGRFAGSPYHQYLGSPVTTLGGQHWTMPADDLMLGTTSFNKQHVPGNSTLDDTTLQREQTSYWMARQLKIPWCYRRYYILYVNGNRHGPLMEDSQVPGGDLLSEYFPTDSNGFLYKNNAWFEFEPGFDSSRGLAFNNNSWCTLNRYTTTGTDGVVRPKIAHYRWNYWMRQSPDSASNYTNVLALVDAANLPPGPAYTAAMESLVDTDEFMRMAALEHATGDWDSFTTQNQWNMYSYKPVNGRWNLLKWDWNITLGNSGSWGPGAANLFTVSGSDPIMARFQGYPPFKRLYLRALEEIATVAMETTNVGPVLDAKFAAFRANGLPSTFGVADPGSSGLKQWISTMRQSILSTLNSQGVASVPFALTSPTNVVTADPTTTLIGTAPLVVRDLLVNGVTARVTWTTTKSWSVVVDLPRQTNRFTLTAVDNHGAPVPLDSLQAVAVNTSAPLDSPAPVRINEWMASNKKTVMNPASQGYDDWFELYNPNRTAEDLGGFFLTTDPGNPTLYQVPSGITVPAGGFLLVWADGGLSSQKDGTNHFLHAGFKLKKSGSTIALLDARTNVTDVISFGPQTADVSMGRFPDGSDLVYPLSTPTPDAPNAYTNTAPFLNPIPDIHVSAGSAVSFQVIANDPDAPPQTLVFSVDPGAPAGLNMDPTSGAVSWSTDPAIAPGDYPVVLRVLDNGTPQLAASETVVIHVVALPSGSIEVAPPVFKNGQLTLQWSATSGSRFRIQYTHDLGSGTWLDAVEELVATSSTATFTDPIPAGDPQRYYRIVSLP